MKKFIVSFAIMAVTASILYTPFAQASTQQCVQPHYQHAYHHEHYIGYPHFKREYRHHHRRPMYILMHQLRRLNMREHRHHFVVHPHFN